MADIGWIKLSTNLPDNKKIKRIRRLPDGDKVILFWVFLLARAGESNQAGGVFITSTLPYSEEDLAADFDFTSEFVKFALMTLEKYSMVTRYDEVLFIKNWEKYQSIDGMEKLREQNRIRQARYREKQKQLALGNVTRNDEITASNALEIEEEKEIDIDSSCSSSSQLSDVVHFYQNNFGIMSPVVQDDLTHWSNDLSPELAIEAMKKASFNQKPYSYAKGIMGNWLQLGIKTLDQVEQQELKFELNKQQSKQVPYKRGQKVESVPEHMNKPYVAKELSPEELAKKEQNEAAIRARLNNLLGSEE